MEDCLFCKIAKKEMESKIIYEDEEFLAFLDLDQEEEGHTLIIPKKHFTDYHELEKETFYKLLEVAKKIEPILMNKLNKTAMTLLLNYGDSQAIKHVHLHLLPNFRYEKGTKTIEEVYDILKDEK